MQNSVSLNIKLQGLRRFIECNEVNDKKKVDRLEDNQELVCKKSFS
jgi:hypothetical protein